MRLDYHEKKGGRESVERRPVKNRPRKESNGLFSLLWVVALLLTYGAGVLTGWLLPKSFRKAPVAAVAQTAKPQQADPAPAASADPAAPLTFYDTLSDGGKGAIGSGLNPKKPDPSAGAPRPAPVAAAAAAAEEPAPPQAKQEAPSRYLVQVASYRDRQEADKAQARLIAKGIAAYVAESKLKDDVVWYRLRVGRQLTKAEAEEIAGKAGKGAAVLKAD